MEEEQDIVVQLKQKPFSSVKFEEKLIIIQNGRPCPPLLNFRSNVTERSRSYTRHFTVSNYEFYNWMCGSECLSKLFCWPCLLFSKGSSKNVWISAGFCNLSGLTKSAKAHERSESHLQCVMDLYNFRKQRIDEGISKTSQTENALHNQKVKRNREVLRHLIDVACFLGKQELPFHGHGQMELSLNKGNYMETFNLLKMYDPGLSEHFNSATICKGIPSDIQNDLVHVISDVLRETILKEVEKSDFVSIMLHETADVKSKSQLSTVLRYVHEDGCIKERFIGFTDVSADRSADGLFIHVKDVVNNYKLQDKFTAHTYDDVAVMSGQVSELQRKVQKEYPKVLFTHCYANVFNLVLSQEMKKITVCNNFFSILNAISNFFLYSSKRTLAIQEHIKKSIPSFSPTIWCFTSYLVNTIEKFREPILDFFLNIHENDDGNWKGSDRCAAFGFVQFLRNFETVFLLNIFSPLFARIDFNALQTEHIDVMTSLNVIQDFEQELKLQRKGFIQCSECINKLDKQTISEEDKCEKCETVGFLVVWEETVAMMDMSSVHRPRNRKPNDGIDSLSPKQRYRKLYYEIIDNLLNHITGLVSSLQKLQFFKLLNPRKFKSFLEPHNFPENLLADVQRVYPDLFDAQGLKNELLVFYRTTIFQNKSSDKVVTFLKDENLDTTFKEIFRLAKLISTIPFKRSFSALKRILTFKSSMQGEEWLSSLALLSIEKELLESIRQNEDFYRTVIQKFAAKTSRIDFVYK